MTGRVSRRALLGSASCILLAACGPPDVTRRAGFTSPPAPPRPQPSWQDVLDTGWESTDSVWRNGSRYYRELDGRARMQTSSTFLARDRFLLSGAGAPTESVDRSEYAAVQRLDFDTPYWFSFQVNVHEAAPESWFLLNQFHDVPDEGAPVVPPPFAAMLLPETQALSVVARAAPPRNRAEYSEVEVYRVEQFERGRWHNFVYNVTFARGGEGHIAIWHDGQAVAEEAVDVGYNDRVGPYFKFGAYRDPTPGDVDVEYANVEMSQSSLLHRVEEPLDFRLRMEMG